MLIINGKHIDKNINICDAPLKQSVAVQKRGFLFEIKAYEKNYRRHINDIPRIFFEHNAEIGQKDRWRMGTS